MLFIYALSAQHHPWFVGWVERSGTHRLRGALAVPVGYASFHPPYEPEVFSPWAEGLSLWAVWLSPWAVRLSPWAEGLGVRRVGRVGRVGQCVML